MNRTAITLNVSPGDVRSTEHTIPGSIMLAGLQLRYGPRTTINDLRAMLGLKPGYELGGTEGQYRASLVIREPGGKVALEVPARVLPSGCSPQGIAASRPGSPESIFGKETFVLSGALVIPDKAVFVLEFGEPLKLSAPQVVTVTVFWGFRYVGDAIT